METKTVRGGIVTTRRLPTKQPTMGWAARRILKASERLARLHELIDQVASSWAHWPRVFVTEIGPTASVRFDYGNLAQEMQEKFDEFDFEASCLAGEVVHYVRSALDYCVNLAIFKQTGSMNRLSKFPIEPSMGKWSDSDRRLRGLTPEQIGWIRGVQPFKEGGEWSGWLAELSNTDKHRAPIAFSIAPIFGFQIPDDAAVGDEIVLNERRMQLAIADIEVGPGRFHSVEVIPTLQSALVGAAGVVNRFLEEEGLPPLKVSQNGVDLLAPPDGPSSIE